MILNRTLTIAAALVVAATAAASASAQTLLDSLLARMKAQRSAVANNANAPIALAAITPTQTAGIDRALATPLQDPRAAADRTAATPLIRALLTTGSCARTGTAFSSLARRMTEPTNPDPYLDAAMPKMRYHDGATCLDLVGVTEWRKPALNALAFTAWYVAPDSGEAASQGFTIQKSSDGEWLIRSIMPTAS